MEYSKLAEYYALLEGTSKRLEKTAYIAELLKKTPEEDLSHIIPLLRGRVFPDWDERKIGVAERLIIKAINVSTGFEPKKIEEEWKKIGDLGGVAEKLLQKKSQSTLFSKHVSSKKVFENLQKLSTLEGADTVNRKVQLIAELLTNASPLEGKYIIRTSLEDLRVGLGDGSLRDAIAWAFLVNPHYNKEEKSITPENREEYSVIVEIVQEAFNKCNDFSAVALAAKKGIQEVQKVSLILGKPIKVMLAQKAKDIADGFERVGRPCALEYKYDGFRMIIHKSDKITIFTRRLEDVTKQFPEVEEVIKKNVMGKNFIIDGEAVGFDPKTGKYLPFQIVSQRIKRKYDIEDVAKRFPVELNVFDVIYYNDVSYLNEPFEKRRKQLEKMVKQEPQRLMLAKEILADKNVDAEKFYQEALNKGNEGIMMKNLQGFYKPGSRVGFMIKVKPTMETLDLVIVGAEWGEGKRSGWLTSFTMACIDEDGNFLEIGKVGTGIKELEQEEGSEGVTFEALTNLLKPYLGKEKGKEVTIKPKVVIEIKYEEIQKSPTYSSGYALRFPRVVRVREADRDPNDISTLELVEELYFAQGS
jgi:DNA ligase 1